VRVAVVGAGIAGLAAARTLKASGVETVVYEKSRLPGGRIATQHLDGFTFDIGATSIAPRGLAIEPVMLQELDTTDLVLVAKPIYVHASLRVSPGDPRSNATHRYTYNQGNIHLPRMMAEDLDVRYEHSVEQLHREGNVFHVLEDRYDAVVLTPPIPQTSALLWSLEESRPVANARYRSCISVQLGFDRSLPELPYAALLDPEQRHPLTWLSVESQKCHGRAPEGGTALVVQMSPNYSFNFYRKHDAEIIGDALLYLGRLFGAETLGAPTAHDVKRWRYSQPDSTAFFDSVNEPGERLLLAGDGLIGGRVESAYESGARAARLLIQSL